MVANAVERRVLWRECELFFSADLLTALAGGQEISSRVGEEHDGEAWEIRLELRSRGCVGVLAKQWVWEDGEDGKPHRKLHAECDTYLRPSQVKRMMAGRRAQVRNGDQRCGSEIVFTFFRRAWWKDPGVFVSVKWYGWSV